MDNVSENMCKNIFLHEPSELPEAFTKLWIQFINDREEKQGSILQTDVSGL